MSNVKVELNSPAIRQLLKSSEVESVCLDQVKRLQAKCGAQTTADTYVGRTRVNAMLTGPKSEIRKAMGATQ